MSSIFRMVSAAGTAITTRMSTGMTVQTISTLVLWTMEVSGTAPCECRNFSSE